MIWFNWLTKFDDEVAPRPSAPSDPLSRRALLRRLATLGLVFASAQVLNPVAGDAKAWLAAKDNSADNRHGEENREPADILMRFSVRHDPDFWAAKATRRALAFTYKEKDGSRHEVAVVSPVKPTPSNSIV